MGDFSHLGESGEAAMVDVSGKKPTQRIAVAESEISLSADCRERLDETMAREIARTARIAGIQAAKQTALLIPLCHSLPLHSVEIQVKRETNCFRVQATTSSHGRTGVEMEAMVAVSIAALTIYDMIKAVEPGAVVGPTRVIRKEGGKAGLWTRES